MADVWPLSWVEQDTRVISDGVGYGHHFPEGFHAPGDSGRAMKSGMAALRIDAVSAMPRSLVLEVTVPLGGGEILVTGPDGHVAVDAHLEPGRRRVSGVFASGALVRGSNRIAVLWRSAVGETGGMPSIRGGWINPAGEGRLSYADYDDSDNQLHLGTGASVEAFLSPRSGAAMRFSIRGDGIAGVEVAYDDTPGERILVKDTTADFATYSLGLPQRQGPLAGLRMTTLAHGATSWRGITFRNMDIPSWMALDSSRTWPVLGDTVAPWNVLLYVVDTLRRDHLQVYGYPKPTTPRLADCIHDWSVWDDCLSLSSWTRPSTATILTGLDPTSHGAMTEAHSIGPGILSLWDPLRLRGWEVAFLTTNSHVVTKWGFASDVDYYRHFEESPTRPTAHLPADSLHLEFLDWLDHRVSRDRPFFAYLHACDPHAPYVPPADLIPRFYPKDCPALATISSERLKDMVCPGIVEPWERDAAEALYDAQIAGWDREFARLLRELIRRGMLERTVIILTSDHGEEFGEHGSFSHGMTLYREQLEVPFLVRVPGSRGSRHDEAMDHRDIGDLLGWIMQGHDAASWTPPVRAHRRAHLSLRGIERARLQTSDFALVWNARPEGSCSRISPEFELFMNDPGETRNVAEDHAVLCRAARATLNAWIRSATPTAPASLDGETMKRLRMLGYVTDE